MNLSNLKVGDSVRVEHGIGRYAWHKGTVERIKSNYLVVGNAEYNCANGYMIGGDTWNACYIKPWSENDERVWREHSRIKRNKRLINKLSVLKPDKISNDHVDALAEILDEYD